MKNIPFVIWMLLYPLLTSFCDKFLSTGEQYSKEVLGITALIEVIIWFFVGYKLYETNE